MSRRFQAAPLVASPCYPNAVVWSEENLIAVACGHLVTILNPAAPLGPRGLITLKPCEPFPIGVVDRKDLLSPCLLPTCLSREVRPSVRSIAWSPIGLAPNAGCLLAVCTTEGRVKLYRMPFCEYSAEWVEVMDVSSRLHLYLESVHFEESENSCSGNAQVTEEQMEGNSNSNQHEPGLKRNQKRRKSLVVIESEIGFSEENIVRDKSVPDGGEASRRKGPKNCDLPLITAEQYALRNGMLSSLVVAWSPILSFTAEIADASLKYFHASYSVLAVGGKSGRVYFWRIFEPESYSIKDNGESFAVADFGFLQAHDSWITALSLAFVSENSNPKVLLATGSSSGCVKIWQAYAKKLVESTGLNHEPFSLLQEVVNIDSSPISVVSLFVSEVSMDKISLAFGKGSGSFEVCTFDKHSGDVKKAGSSNAHEQVVTGLAWAFGGKCLYSCSQDNTFRSWILHDNSITEVPLPSNTPGLRSSAEVPNVYDLCFGVAVSPGSLVIAVAHNFDAELLNPMYQERTLKAAVEFIWIGGQQLDLVFYSPPDFYHEAFPGFPEKELMSWENNILKSRNQYQRVDKPLVVWDAVAALCAFNQSFPSFVQHILRKWMRCTFGSQFEISSSQTCMLLSSITSRQLHIINILSRHVMLKELKINGILNGGQDVEELNGAEEQQILWLKLLRHGEKELRERLLYINFSSVLSSSIHLLTPKHWIPIGVGQMTEWAMLNRESLKILTTSLAEEVRKLENGSRLGVSRDGMVEEKCTLCSAPVKFKSAEIAFCQGAKNGVGFGQSHKLARCSVSMVLCPVAPSWFCRSCHRWASNVAPPSFFSMVAYSSDFKSVAEIPVQETPIKPTCAFCGVLLQRQQPEFLLSPSSV